MDPNKVGFAIAGALIGLAALVGGAMYVISAPEREAEARRNEEAVRALQTKIEEMKSGSSSAPELKELMRRLEAAKNAAAETMGDETLDVEKHKAAIDDFCRESAALGEHPPRICKPNPEGHAMYLFTFVGKENVSDDPDRERMEYQFDVGRPGRTFQYGLLLQCDKPTYECTRLEELEEGTILAVKTKTEFIKAGDTPVPMDKEKFHFVRFYDTRDSADGGPPPGN